MLVGWHVYKFSNGSEHAYREQKQSLLLPHLLISFRGFNSRCYSTCTWSKNNFGLWE